MFSNPFKRPTEVEIVAASAPSSEMEQTSAPVEIEEPPSELVSGPASTVALEPTLEVAAPMPETALLPEVEPLPLADDKGSEPAVVRPLFVGAFLNGELEIVEVLERGPINFYRANAGGWGENEWKWVWERPATDSISAPPTDEFFAPATRFVRDGREYAVYEWDERQPFADWRASANDDTFLEFISPLACALESLQDAHLQPHIEADSLWFHFGELYFFGFCDQSNGEGNALVALEQLGSTLAKAHLAPRATLRLDDVWASLPFSLELKGWARQLESGGFSSITEARSALERFAAPSRAQIEVQTDVGLEREHNEDGVTSFSLRRAGQGREASFDLLAVADGMGGHEAGEVASQTALDALQMALLKQPDADWNDNAQVLSLGRELIAGVNAAVIAQNEAPPFSAMRQKPGTTLVFALRLGRRLLVGNVGDSRLYRWNPSSGLQLWTKDHSYVQDLIDAGRLHPEEAWNHPDGSIITSHIGMTRGLLSDVSLRLVAPGDRVVLVSDGVVDTLRDVEIETVIASANDARTLCQSLVDAANEAGGIDNISVAAMFCE